MTNIIRFMRFVMHIPTQELAKLEHSAPHRDTAATALTPVPHPLPPPRRLGSFCYTADCLAGGARAELDSRARGESRVGDNDKSRGVYCRASKLQACVEREVHERKCFVTVRMTVRRARGACLIAVLLRRKDAWCHGRVAYYSLTSQK